LFEGFSHVLFSFWADEFAPFLSNSACQEISPTDFGFCSKGIIQKNFSGSKHPWEGKNMVRRVFSFLVSVEEGYPMINRRQNILLYVKLFLLGFKAVKRFISVNGCPCSRGGQYVFPIFVSVLTEAAL
jgi:hypothetical protein